MKIFQRIIRKHMDFGRFAGSSRMAKVLRPIKFNYRMIVFSYQFSAKAMTHSMKGKAHKIFEKFIRVSAAKLELMNEFKAKLGRTVWLIINCQRKFRLAVEQYR